MVHQDLQSFTIMITFTKRRKTNPALLPVPAFLTDKGYARRGTTWGQPQYFEDFLKSLRMAPQTGHPVRLRNPHQLWRTPFLCRPRSHNTHARTHTEGSLWQPSFIMRQMFVLDVNSEIGKSSHRTVMNFIQLDMSAHNHTLGHINKRHTRLSSAVSVSTYNRETIFSS